MAVFKGCLPIYINGPKSLLVWRIVSFVLCTTHNSNLRTWLSESALGFEMVKMVWALASKFQIQFLLHFYVGMTLFWLHLNFYICIPRVNKLPATFEKQIPLNKLKNKVAKRYSYWNCRASKRSLLKHSFWECDKVLDQLHQNQVIPFTFSAPAFGVQF